MIRRTVTLPEELAAEIDALVKAGYAANVSRFMQEAARAHVDVLRAREIAEEARKLDPVEEVALARPFLAGASDGDPGRPPPWGRLSAPGAPRGRPGGGEDTDDAG